MLLKKYQSGNRFSQPDYYKGIFSEQEINEINKTQDPIVFKSNKKECAGDACRNLAPVMSHFNKPNYYAILKDFEDRGGFKDKPKDVLREGANSSWHNAGIASENGAIVHYNDKIQKPEELEAIFNKNLPIGTFVLLGNGSPRNPNGYSKSKNFTPSNHTMIVYGYTDKGQPLLMDGYTKQLYTKEDALKNWNSYNIQSVFTPKEYNELNYDYINQFEKNKLSREQYTVGLKDNKQEKVVLDKYGFYNVNYNSPKYYDRMKKHALYGDKREKFDPGQMSIFMQTLHDIAPSIATDLKLNNEDYTKLANLASSIALNESKGGKGLSGISGWVDRSFTKSQGMTQLDLNQIDPALRKILSEKYNIEDSKDLNDPAKSAIATMYHLAELANTATNSYKRGLNHREYVAPNSPSLKTRLGNLWRGRETKTHNGYYTSGNAQDLPWEQQMAYGWRGLKKLRTGDAQGKDKYTRNVLEDYENFNIMPLPTTEVVPKMLIHPTLKSILYNKKK
jgi:hypothetical protein